jgi:hypothetical protein
MDIKKDPMLMIQLYLDECEEWLSGKRADFPNPEHLLHGLPSSSVTAACIGNDSIGPFIAVHIRDGQPGREPLKFDPAYFAALRVIEQSGARIRFHRNQRHDHPRRKDYLVISGATKAHGLTRVLRFITDAPIEMTVAQLPADYHEYRRVVLSLTVRRRGTPPRSDRSTAIELALALFRAVNVDPQDADKYLMLIERAVSLADKMHERMHPDEEGDDNDND